MCHFVTKICDKFMTNKKGSAGWKLRGGGGSQKTLPVTTHQVKKEKNINYYYYYYYTILSGERYLAKNAKNKYGFSTQNIVQNICV